MKRDCLFDLSLDFVARVARCDTTRNIWRVCGETGLGLLDDNQVLHGFKPACLRMLFNVPGATSSPGLPATVTSPWLELPSHHPGISDGNPRLGERYDSSR